MALYSSTCQQRQLKWTSWILWEQPLKAEAQNFSPWVCHSWTTSRLAGCCDPTATAMGSHSAVAASRCLQFLLHRAGGTRSQVRRLFQHRCPPPKQEAADHIVICYTECDPGAPEPQWYYPAQPQQYTRPSLILGAKSGARVFSNPQRVAHAVGSFPIARYNGPSYIEHN